MSAVKQKTESKWAGFLRAAVVIVAVILQLILLWVLVRYLHNQALIIYILIELLALINILYLLGKRQRSTFTSPWITIIALLPVFGNLLYLLWGRGDVRGKRHARIRAATERSRPYLIQDPQVLNTLTEKYPDRRRIVRYLGREGYPLYQHTDSHYYSLGEKQFADMLDDLKTAEHFIFISTFILNSGILWDQIKAILIEKAKQGLDVRLMFDDFGSIFTAPDRLMDELRAYGVQVLRFNPIHEFVSKLSLNYRNHQKITVVDGNIGYTGGANIADEYINEYDKYGHWKDTGIRLYGDAVYSLTLTFLTMWEAECREEQDYEQFRPSLRTAGQGYFQPFADGPANNPQNPAETVFLHMINTAHRYLYISTPYLAVDDKMLNALCVAALSGVDVRIVLPSISDHWYVQVVSRSNYHDLLLSGVKVYEYSPGFIHAKMLLSDDEEAVIGTINMDYRSFYFHFENGVWICDDPSLVKMKEDFEDIFMTSQAIYWDEYIKRPWYLKLLEAVLRVFDVLM